MRLVAKGEVERRLQQLGAFWASNLDDQHALWMLPWGFAIQVPIVPPDATMWEVDVAEIEDELRQEIQRMRP